MKNNLDLYNKTVDILFNAYFNDTLHHGQCHACAVGNLINARMPFTKKQIEEMKTNKLGNPIYWPSVFCTYNAKHGRPDREFHPSRYTGVAKDQIDSTGYSLEELSEIEYRFETAPGDYGSEDHMFNGLCAVLEVLKEIHGIKEDEHTTQVSRFQNHYATK